MPVAVEGDLGGGVAELGRDVFDVLAALDECARVEVPEAVNPDVPEFGLHERRRPDAVPEVIRVDGGSLGGHEDEVVGRHRRLRVARTPQA